LKLKIEKMKAELDMDHLLVITVEEDAKVTIREEDKQTMIRDEEDVSCFLAKKLNKIH